ncbi:hypothetical protein OUZ56_009890 [Daphnia magna]|uniref:Uncharacterized protein n=1 Tax=Daphnia magna TaxID=35525 RepID=A0ABR0AH65_9CRUS|nr:hypothetical protein OUZ56_009890 [Daphnia magna]
MDSPCKELFISFSRDKSIKFYVLFGRWGLPETRYGWMDTQWIALAHGYLFLHNLWRDPLNRTDLPDKWQIGLQLHEEILRDPLNHTDKK